MQHAFFLLLALLLLGCNQSRTTSGESTSPLPLQKTNSRAQILNNIVVHESGGLKLSKAFLSNTSGNLLNRDNTVNAGDTVCLNLVVAQGWMAENGMVSIGASQNIFTDRGEPILPASDLFAGTPKIEEAKAHLVQLKTTINSGRTDARSFVVRYRLWDKNGTGEVTGNYNLRLAKDTAQ